MVKTGDKGLTMGEQEHKSMSPECGDLISGLALRMLRHLSVICGMKLLIKYVCAKTSTLMLI